MTVHAFNEVFDILLSISALNTRCNSRMFRLRHFTDVSSVYRFVKVGLI